jgi:L-rhamnose mutarotase
MIRRAFTMRLKPDALADYKRHHDNIWPELVAEIERAGIASITTFQRDLDLFLISEISDEAAWDRLWNSEIHRRWAEVMEPLMHLRDDGIVDSGELAEVFHLRTSGNGRPTAEPADDLIAAILAEAAGQHADEPVTEEQLAAPGREPAKAVHKKAMRPRKGKSSVAKKMAAKKTPSKKGKAALTKRPAAKKSNSKKKTAKKTAPKKAIKRAAKKKAKKR